MADRATRPGPIDLRTRSLTPSPASLRAPAARLAIAVGGLVAALPLSVPPHPFGTASTPRFAVAFGAYETGEPGDQSSDDRQRGSLAGPTWPVRGLPAICIESARSPYEPLDPDPTHRALQRLERASSFEGARQAVDDPNLRSTALARMAQILDEQHRSAAGSTTARGSAWQTGDEQRSSALRRTVEALADTTASVRVTAAYALGSYGTDALPHVRSALASSERDVVSAAILSLGKLGARSSRSALDSGASAETMQEVLALLEEQLTSMPTPDGRNRDPFDDPRRPLASALGQCGSAAVPLIAKSLTSSRSEVRAASAWAATFLGPEAAPLLPGLLDALDQPISERAARDEWSIAHSAASAIASVGEPGVQALLARLEKIPPENAEAVLRALRESGTTDGQLLASIHHVLREGPEELKTPFFYALMVQDPSAVCDYFVDMVDRPSQGFDLLHLATRLEECRADLTPISPDLVALLNASGWTHRLAAVIALRHTTSDPDATAAQVFPLLEDPQTIIQAEATKTLGVLARTSDVALTRLTELLRDERHEIEAIEALGLAGEVAAPVVPTLTHWIESESAAGGTAGSVSARAHRAALALVRIDAAAALESLVPMLDDRDPQRRALAIQALWQVAEGTDVTAPVLLRLLDSEPRDARDAAYRLADIAAKHPPVQKALVDHLGSAEPLRQALMSVLSRKAENEPWVVPALVGGLEHEDPGVRATCAILLERVALPSDAVVAALHAAATDPEEVVRWYADLALLTLTDEQ